MYQTTAQADARYLVLDAPRTVSFQPAGGPVETTSVNGLYCGHTSSATLGKIGAIKNGLYSARQACKAVSGCGPNAHMCSSQEIITSVSLNAVPPGEVGNQQTDVPPPAWVATGNAAFGSSAGNTTDCEGFNAVTGYGSVLAYDSSTLGYRMVPYGCSANAIIACCK